MFGAIGTKILDRFHNERASIRVWLASAACTKPAKFTINKNPKIAYFAWGEHVHIPHKYDMVCKYKYFPASHFI